MFKINLQEAYENFFILNEKSQGKLKSSFRMASDVTNGHNIKIVYDLNPSDVKQVGDHSRQDGRDPKKDREITKNIRKNGSNDFSSTGTVKAIIDMDTGKRLNSVKTIGVIGNAGTRFQVPSEYYGKDKGLGNDEGSFTSHTMKNREEMASKQKDVANAKDAITISVGEKEKVPTYKSTTNSFSAGQVYNNQYSNKSRGIAKSFDHKDYRDNMHINTYISKLEKRYAILKKKAEEAGIKDSDIADDCEEIEWAIDKLKKRAAQNPDEKSNQTPTSSRYRSVVTTANLALSSLNHSLNKK